MSLTTITVQSKRTSIKKEINFIGNNFKFLKNGMTLMDKKELTEDNVSVNESVEAALKAFDVS